MRFKRTIPLTILLAAAAACSKTTGESGPVSSVMGCGNDDPGSSDGETAIALLGCGGANSQPTDVGLIGEVGHIDTHDPETKAQLEAFWKQQKLRSELRDKYRQLSDAEFEKFFKEVLKDMSESEIADFIEMLKIALARTNPNGSIMDPNDLEALGKYTDSLQRMKRDILARVAQQSQNGIFPSAEDRKALIDLQNRLEALAGHTNVVVEEKTKWASRTAGGTSSTQESEASATVGVSGGVQAEAPVAPGIKVGGGISGSASKTTKETEKTTKERPAHEMYLEVTVIDVRENGSQDASMPMQLRSVEDAPGLFLAHEAGDGPHREPSEHPTAPRKPEAAPRRNVVHVATYYKWVHPCMLVDRTLAERQGQPVQACPPALPPTDDPSAPLPEGAGNWVKLNPYQRGAYIYLEQVFPDAYSTRKAALTAAVAQLKPMVDALEAARQGAATVVTDVNAIATKPTVTVDAIIAAANRAKAKANEVCSQTLVKPEIVRAATLAKNDFDALGEEYLGVIKHLEGIDNHGRMKRFWDEGAAPFANLVIPALGAGNAICQQLLASYTAIPLRIQKEKADHTSSALTSISDAIVADQLTVSRTMKRADLKLEALAAAQKITAPLRSARTHSRYALGKELAAGAEQAFTGDVGHKIDQDPVLTAADKTEAKKDALAAIRAEVKRWNDFAHQWGASGIVADHTSLVQPRLDAIREYIKAKPAQERQQLFDVWHGALASSGLSLAGGCVVLEMRFLPSCWEISAPTTQNEGALIKLDDKLTLLERTIAPFETEIMGGH